ncbi:hypothetical protein, partial [Lactobacillus gallinarum]|uniref:hypothetical protein n=1 Tax=Lactobacillus gallinarum TaxID=52242 RepID=UPI001EF4B85A
SLFKNKNRQKKTVKQLKLRVGLIVFQYLRVSFFPDTYFIQKKRSNPNDSISKKAPLIVNVLT